jgi:hypothetical protein
MTVYAKEGDVGGLAERLLAIREACDAMYSVVDFADSVTFDGVGANSSAVVFDYSAAYSQALQRPSATACAYINEQQLRLLRARSRAFCVLNPYWMAVKENRISYAIGTGHVWSIVPRHKGDKISDSLHQNVMDEIEQFVKINKYRRRQGEKLTRLDRDGEFFLRFLDNKADDILRVRFIEPILVQDPPGKSAVTNTWFGVQFDGIDYEEPLGYYIRPATYDGGLSVEQSDLWGRMVPAEDIQHRTVNVDIGSPRGLPSTYSLQENLTQALSTLKSMGKLVDIRARIALIRKQVNATLGQIQPLLTARRVGQVTGTGNKLLNAFGFPYGTVVDTNDQRSYEFPSQNIETDKIVHSLKADLQSVAAAMGIADFTISGDSSAAFANALVKEGPMDRAIGRLQQDLIDDDIEVYERALMVAADHGRLPRDVLKTVRIDIMPPGVIARDRLTMTQANQILWQCGAMSSDTMAMQANLDPSDEKAKGAEPKIANGDTNPAQAGKAKSTARGVPAGKEPGPGVNPTNVERAKQESLDESVASRNEQRPTAEDLRVAASFITPEWLEATKRELLGLPQTMGSIKNSNFAYTTYEDGIQGFYMGVVDGQQVWGVDFGALIVKHNAPDLGVVANSDEYGFVPRNHILVNWDHGIQDVMPAILHELIEQKAQTEIGWNHARACRLAAYMPGGEMDFRLALRPDLLALQN